MRAWAIIATVVVAGTLAAGGTLAAMLLRGGISARSEPSSLEASLAFKALRMALRGSRDKRNPVPPSPEVIGSGLSHFADHCASCHANDGSGQTEMGQHLYPRVPDMRLARTQELTDGELFAIIEDGVRFTGMPAWGDKSEQSQLASWHLVHFIRHLPHLTPEERLRMEALNPKGPEERQEEQDEESFLKGQNPAPAKGGHHRDRRTR
jgi:mono/diheme cytochrome c family protein